MSLFHTSKDEDDFVDNDEIRKCYLGVPPEQ